MTSTDVTNTVLETVKSAITVSTTLLVIILGILTVSDPNVVPNNSWIETLIIISSISFFVVIILGICSLASIVRFSQRILDCESSISSSNDADSAWTCVIIFSCIQALAFLTGSGSLVLALFVRLLSY